MMSAGLIGSPGLGYAKDRFASEGLEANAPAVYAEYKQAEPKGWLFFKEVSAIDPTKLGEVRAAATAGDELTDDQKAVVAADVGGDRSTLRADSFIPMGMAAIYLFLFIYFRSIGGYKPVTIESGGDDGAEKTT